MNTIKYLGLLVLVTWSALLIVLPHDKTISVTKTKMGEAFQSEISDTQVGFCMKCGIGFDGELDCFPKPRPDCPCKQNVMLQKYSVVEKYQSGAVERREGTEIIEKIGECK